MFCYAAQENTVFLLIKVIIEFKIKTTTNISQITETKKKKRWGQRRKYTFEKVFHYLLFRLHVYC